MTGSQGTTRRLLTAVLTGALISTSVLVIVDTGGTAGADPQPSVLTASPTTLDMGAPPLGTYNGPETFTLTNNSANTDSIDLLGNDLTFTGAGWDDYLVVPGAGCPGNGYSTVILAPHASCTMDVSFYPGALGPRPATITITGSADTTGTSVQVTGTGVIGYYQVDEFGDVGYAGDAPFYGDAGNIPLNQPIVAITPTGNNGGYWLVASDGGIFSYGDAAFYGSTGAIALNKPIVGMTKSADGKGYWEVASDGGIFSFGDAQFYGSTGGFHINQPIVGMAATPDGGGYWLVAADGGIFSFGDAPFYGSAGSIPLNQPIVSMAAMPDGSGYWFSAADGGLFNFGGAPFYGSGVDLGFGPIVDMATNGDPTVQASGDFPASRHGDLDQLFRSGHLDLPRANVHRS